MKKSLFSFIPAVFVGIALLALTGCPQPQAVPPSADQQPPPTVRPGTTSVDPHVEPLQPAGGKKEAVTEPKKEEPKKEGALLIPAETIGKIAAEAVPLPPVDDLVAQADDYVEKIGKTIEDLDGTAKFKEDADAMFRDANGLALVALAIGKSEADSKYKKAAPGIIKAAMDLAAIDNLNDAKKGFEALKTSLTSAGDPATLQWTKVASLAPVMKAVPNLDSAVKRMTSTESKMKKQMAKDGTKITGPLAAIAAIAQGSIANAKETIKPDQEAEWKKECELFRDAAIKANNAAKGFGAGTGDYAAFEAAYKTLAETCETCHKIFQPGH